MAGAKSRKAKTATGKRSASSSAKDRYFVNVCNRYARDVVAGKIIACEWVTKACQRHLDDIEKSAQVGFAYSFDAAPAGRACRFIERLPHVKGEWARITVGQNGLIRLEAWQIFIVCSLFGWVNKSDGFRRFAEAYIEVARKNAKSTLAAAIGLYMLVADHEYGPEVYSGATTKKQAMEVFRTARRMAKKALRFKEYFDLEVNTESIVKRGDDGKFEPLIGDPGDGASPSCAIVDEYHEHPNSNLHDTMVTGMGARRQGLIINITTAGSNTSGPCYIARKDSEKILQGLIENEAFFCIIFCADEGDDWKSNEAAKKANPNHGVSVFESYLEKQRREAIQSPQKQFIYKTKHLNIWGNSLNSFYNMEDWAKCRDGSLKIEEFAGHASWMGVDLASKIDLASRVRLFQEMRTNSQGVSVRHYTLFAVHYAPLDRIMDGEHPHYQRWYEDGHLVGIPGPEIQLSAIQTEIEDELDKYDFQRLAFDPWSALQMQQELAEQLGEDVVMSIPQTTRYLSDPMKELQAAMAAGRVHHNGDPILTWSISCVVARADANDNYFPRKLENGKDKIDPHSALLNALNPAMLGEIKRRYTRPIVGVL